MLLTDGYLANGAEPWVLPDVDALPDISVPFATEPNHGDEFWPYLRDPETLARPWAIPGTPGLMHRVGGIEKEDGTGNISYDPANHDKMTRLRAAKIAGIANDIPLTDVDDPDGADLLVLSWGGTWGATTEATRRIRARGKKIAHAHLRHMNPFPRDLGDVLQPLFEGARARAEPRPAVEAGASRSSWSTRSSYTRVRRRAVPRRGAREQDPGDDAVVTDGNGNGTAARVKLARKDFQSDQEVRWCPGCGDYGILTAIQLLLPETRRASPRTSCSSRASAARRACRTT